MSKTTMEKVQNINNDTKHIVTWLLYALRVKQNFGIKKIIKK